MLMIDGMNTLRRESSHVPGAQAVFLLVALDYGSTLLHCVREAQSMHYGHYMIMYSYLNCILVNMLRIWREKGFVPSYEVSAPSGSSIETITEYRIFRRLQNGTLELRHVANIFAEAVQVKFNDIYYLLEIA